LDEERVLLDAVTGAGSSFIQNLEFNIQHCVQRGGAEAEEKLKAKRREDERFLPLAS